MPYGLCWLVLLCGSLGLVVGRLGLPWWADFLIGLAGGLTLVWGAALALCHQGTVILRWTHQEDETTAAARAPRPTP